MTESKGLLLLDNKKVRGSEDNTGNGGNKQADKRMSFESPRSEISIEQIKLTY